MSNFDEAALLEKLNEVNRSLQMDCKSVHSLSLLVRKCSIENESTSGNDDDKISLSSMTTVDNNSETKNSVLEKWNNVITTWQESTRRRNQVRELIKQSNGIPHQFRPIMWQLLCGSNDERSFINKRKELYPDYLKKQSPCENSIRRDISRTYPQHAFFRDENSDGQTRLFNIMKAYSIHDREVGYCQGSGFIGGLLLLQMPEEEAFAVLVSLLFEHQLRKLYKPSMSELELCMYQLDLLVKEYLPTLFSHFQTYHFLANVYASGWFLTLFTLPFSIDLASRVMDLFILDGIEVIFKISLAYLTMFQNDLLAMDMELMLRFLQTTGPQRLEEDPNKLFDISFQIKLNTRKMKKVEKEFLALKNEEEVHQIELRRLRSENGLLLQRIDHLEKEIHQLTQHLEIKNIILNENSQEIGKLRCQLIESNQEIELLQRNHKENCRQSQIDKCKINSLKCSDKTEDLSATAGLNCDPGDVAARSPFADLNGVDGELVEVKNDKCPATSINRRLYMHEAWSLDPSMQEHIDTEYPSDTSNSRPNVLELESMENRNNQLISQSDKEIIIFKEMLKESQCIQMDLIRELDEANVKMAEIEVKHEEEFRIWGKQMSEAKFLIVALQKNSTRIGIQSSTFKEVEMTLQNPYEPFVKGSTVFNKNKSESCLLESLYKFKDDSNEEAHVRRHNHQCPNTHTGHELCADNI